MKRMRHQILMQFLLLLAVVLAVLAIFASVMMFPSQIFLHKQSLKRAYRRLGRIDLEYMLENPHAANADLEDVIQNLSTSHIHYLIMNSEFAILAADNGGENTDHRRELLSGQADKFTREALTAYETEEHGSQTALYGKITSGDREYLIYLYIRLAGVSNRVTTYKIAMWVTAAICLLAAFFCLRAILGRNLKPGRAIMQEVDALANGDYEGRITAPMPDNSFREVAWKLNRIAGRLSTYQHDLDNYAYLMRTMDLENLYDERARKETITQITHQLKTPLAILTSQMELLQEETDEEKRNYYCASMMEEIEKMSFLISNILKDAQRQKRDFAYVPRRISLTEFITELAGKYESILLSKQIVFESRISPGIDAVADPVYIEQAVHNYMMNAIVHTKSGKTIILSLSADDGYARIGVHNDGERVPDALAEKIWGNFYRGDQKEEAASVGLGLYIVADIMRMAGGEYGFVNDDSGVEFYMRLKLYKNSSEEAGGSHG